MRARRRWSVTGIVSALVLCGPSTAAGQVTAVGQQDLSFGLLVPGTETAIGAATDAAQRGEWLLTGRGNTTVSLVLPAELVAASGATIPLVFGARDAAWQRSNGGVVTTVDPRGPFSVNVPNRQTVRLFLGGTAQTPASAPAGSYSATITLIVAQP